MPVIRERVAGLDPSRFWAAPLMHVELAGLVAKYEALAELARMSEGDERKQALRRAARRWPGSLREAELIGPVLVDARLALARAGLEQSEAPRERWREHEGVSLVGWSSLHGLLGDLRRFRAAAVQGFTEWVMSLPPDDPVHQRWPERERIEPIVGLRPSTRAMYLWLAARMGLSLPTLNALLLARSGAWDRRPGDPSWAHDE